jgi:predicted amidohydrolase
MLLPACCCHALCSTQLVVCDSPAGRLGLTVCYDLRFPEVFQTLTWRMGAQVLLVPSAFTKVTGEVWGALVAAGGAGHNAGVLQGPLCCHGVFRKTDRRPASCCCTSTHLHLHHGHFITGAAHWEVLLRARAIECQAYVIAAAQAGVHNEKRASYGHSIIVDPWGVVVARLDDPHATGAVCGVCACGSSSVGRPRVHCRRVWCMSCACGVRMRMHMAPVFDTNHGRPTHVRLPAGIAVAELDFAALAAVRQKMPIQQHRAKGRQQLAGQLQ